MKRDGVRLCILAANLNLPSIGVHQSIYSVASSLVKKGAVHLSGLVGIVVTSTESDLGVAIQVQSR